jgi:deoxycytidylate deaminase
MKNKRKPNKALGYLAVEALKFLSLLVAAIVCFGVGSRLQASTPIWIWVQTLSLRMKKPETGLGGSCVMCKPNIQKITVKAAKKSIFPKFRHSCAIERGGSIIAIGVNTPKPRTPNVSFSTHAEIWTLKRLLTILARQKKTGKFELYVARIAPQDDIAYSRPCEKCMAALKDSGVIDIVHYTTDKGDWESIEI